MPWITKEEREVVDTKLDSLKVVKKGEVTYCYYKRFLKLWNDKQKYDTIHFVGLLREHPENDRETWELTKKMLFKGLFKSELFQCRSDAHHQIERLYFDPYEDKKREENGEVCI